jgi:DNA-binding response OmpR family regulator
VAAHALRGSAHLPLCDDARLSGTHARLAAMKTILIADDDPTIVVSLQFLLEQAGYAVRVARDGQEALDAMASEVPDLLLLDVMMPRLSGYDVCQRVRESGILRQVRILMLTARGGAVEARKGLALGADGYMTKPFATQELLSHIRELLG